MYKRQRTLMQGGKSAIPGYTRTTSLAAGTRPQVFGKELKYQDKVSNMNTTDIGVTGDEYVVFSPFSDIPRSTSVEGRDGQKLYAKKLEARWKAIIQKSASSTVELDWAQTLCRLIIVQDCQVNGAQCAIGDILQLTDKSGNTIHTSSAPYNMANWKRFKILKDETKTLTMQPIGNNQYAVGGCVTEFKVDIPLQMTITYAPDDTTGDTVNIKDNNLYGFMIFFSHPVGLEGVEARVLGNTRVYWTD